MSDLAASSTEVNGFKANPLESSQFLRYIEWQKALVSTIKAHGASTYFTDAFTIPMAAQDESELSSLQMRYSDYLAVKLRKEECAEKLATKPQNRKLRQLVQLVTEEMKGLGWRKTEKQQACRQLLFDLS